MSDASVWQAQSGTTPVINAAGQVFEEVQVATAGKTVFTLLTFQYTPGTRSIFVFRKTAADAGVGGEMLRRGIDYTETSTTVVTMAVGAVLNDVYTFVALAVSQVTPSYATNGLPVGGTAAQYLVKLSGSDYNVGWASLVSPPTLLDAPRQNIASAATVNLSAIAATTRNILITGNTQIDGFQISNGQVWAVRFAATLILKNNANINTGCSQDIMVSSNDSCLVRATADNVVEILTYTKQFSSMPNIINGFRLTLTSGLPVTTADVIGAANIYLTPYTGNTISLFDGTSWINLQSAEVSLALAALVAGRPYDVFVRNVGGVPTLSAVAWTNDTTRATGLSYQDGVLVQTGGATLRYVGTFYTTAVNTTEDSNQNRYLWNYYNRIKKVLYKAGTAANWVYGVGAWRQANADVTNKVQVVSGFSEDSISLRVDSNITAAAISTAFIGIGLDSTAATSSIGGVASCNAGFTNTIHSPYESVLTPGRHALNWIENAVSGVATTYGGQQAGALSGSWRC